MRGAGHRFTMLSRPLSRTKVPKGLWVSTPLWPGPSSAIQFANGTSQNFETLATTGSVPFPYGNGTAFYQFLCKPKSVSSRPKRSAMSNSVQDKAEYPKAKIHDECKVFSGFFSNETALRDTAILTVPTFGAFPAHITDFPRSLARRAKANGKKKVFIDLSGNGGGAIMLTFQLFQIFFPGEKIYLGFRFRAHETVDYFGQAFAHLNYSASYQSGRSESNPLPYRMQVIPDKEHGFSFWNELYGPHEIQGANVSRLFATYNFTAISPDTYSHQWLRTYPAKSRNDPLRTGGHRHDHRRLLRIHQHHLR